MNVQRIDMIAGTIISDSQEQLVNLFREMFGEEIESEAMLELIAKIQLYATTCMRTALLIGEKK